MPAGMLIVDGVHASKTSQLIFENGISLVPPTFSDVNNVTIGTLCRCWVNFDAYTTGVPEIKNSFNVSSITDHGVGQYTVNFTNAMPDINYVSVASTSAFPSAQFAATPNMNTFPSYQESAPTTSGFRFTLARWDNSAAGWDQKYVSAVVFR